MILEIAMRISNRVWVPKMMIHCSEEKRLAEFTKQVSAVLMRRVIANRFKESDVRLIVKKLEGEIYSQMKVGYTPVEVADDLKRQWDNGSLKGKLL